MSARGAVCLNRARTVLRRGGGSNAVRLLHKKPIILITLAVLTITNLISFFLMEHDKKCARQGKWRVPEKTLFLATACFGGLGGVLGMKVFHHKTKHWNFKMFFPALLVIQVALLVAGLYWLYR